MLQPIPRKAILTAELKLPKRYSSPPPTASLVSGTVQIFDADGNLLVTVCATGDWNAV